MGYKEGWLHGVMTVGPHAGTPVCKAKEIIAEEMVQEGTAVKYFEPDAKVVSRTQDRCVVAHTEQWFIDYGEAEWRAVVQKHLDTMETYNPIAQQSFNEGIEWLNKWACSRKQGLGTRLPWDPKYVIESLSDSTIYMAYYTIAHILQGGEDFAGSTTGIRAEDLNDAVFDSIFFGSPIPAGC